jgi:galactokinase
MPAFSGPIYLRAGSLKPRKNRSSGSFRTSGSPCPGTTERPDRCDDAPPRGVGLRNSCPRSSTVRALAGNRPHSVVASLYFPFMDASHVRSVGEVTEALGSPPDVVVRSPGRVNLIGDHTDYNDGFVMPFAIDREVIMAVRQRSDREVHARSLQMDDGVHFDLDRLEHGGPPWGEYLKGVMQESDYTGRGLDLVVSSDVPVGAGLSSSAALEIGLARALVALSGTDWDPVAAALACQRAENEWVGTQSGIMDQLVVADAVAGSALLIDCRSLKMTPVAMSADVVAVVFDTGTRRSLVDTGYNERRRACRRAAAAYGVSALRDVTPEQVAEKPDGLDEADWRKARHVVTENQRVLAMADALANGRLAELRHVMSESHSSLRDDLDVTTRELDLMARLALAQPGCVGTRMTGAGFGGCTVALFDEPYASAALEKVVDDYSDSTGTKPRAFACRSAPGVSLITDF